MMQTFDLTNLPGGAPPSTTTPPRNEDDPFAKVDINGGGSGLSTGLATSERPRPTTSTPARVTTSTAQSPGASPPPKSTYRGDSMGATIGSWVVLAAAAAATIFGITFAGWTSESLDLDASLMPAFEGTLGVHPPRSFHGADDMPVDELRRLAQAKETEGDLAGAAVAWRRVQARDPADKTATSALPRVMTALGERLR
jgi:hypothetical protein